MRCLPCSVLKRRRTSTPRPGAPHSTRRANGSPRCSKPRICGCPRSAAASPTPADSSSPPTKRSPAPTPNSCARSAANRSPSCSPTKRVPRSGSRSSRTPSAAGWSPCAWSPKASTSRAWQWACMRPRHRRRCSSPRRSAASCAPGAAVRPPRSSCPPCRSCWPWPISSSSSATTHSTAGRTRTPRTRSSSTMRHSLRPMPANQPPMICSAPMKPLTRRPRSTGCSSTAVSSAPAA